MLQSPIHSGTRSAPLSPREAKGACPAPDAGMAQSDRGGCPYLYTEYRSNASGKNSNPRPGVSGRTNRPSRTSV